MIPIRDNIYSRTWPFITILVILANCYFFYQELILSNAGLNRLVAEYGLIPAKFIDAIGRTPLREATYIPLFTNLFLHGGWLHLIGNMWYLWIFGDNIEDLLGHFRFILFYLLCGVAANLSQVYMDPTSHIPTIGASGAISGILGAYLISFPWARIATLIPIFPFFPVVQIPALLFLAFWFLLQLNNGAIALFMAGTTVAWWAHIGGFVTGMVLIGIMRKKERYNRHKYG